ncbi:MAG: hypothetical protein ACT4ON_06395 [Bacteroidota bacterium]
MKKIFLLILISSFGMMSYAQTKSDKIDLDNIKRFYDRLKNYKIDTKTELVWEYTYEDTTQIQLQKLGETFEKGGLKIVEIAPTKRSPKIYYLKVSELKKYPKPENLNERVKSLNEVALVHKIMSPYAAMGAEKPQKEGGIGTYKKVGKQK